MNVSDKVDLSTCSKFSHRHHGTRFEWYRALPLSPIVEGSVDINTYNPYNPEKGFQIMVKPVGGLIPLEQLSRLKRECALKKY